MFIQSISGDMSDLPGNDWDSFEPDIFEVLHPTLGRIEEPEYYFETLASAIEEECI